MSSKSNPSSTTTVNRRRFLGGVGAAAALGTAGTVVSASPAAASGRNFSRSSAPKPIEFLTPPAVPPAPDPFNTIHWTLPGPPGATTQIIGLPAFGLDADPSTIGDYEGFTAYAVIAGTGTGGDGEPYDVEFDLRVMQGNYIGEDGQRHSGTFAFL